MICSTLHRERAVYPRPFGGRELCVAKAALKPERTRSVARNFVLRQLSNLYGLAPWPGVLFLRQHSDLYGLSLWPRTLVAKAASGMYGLSPWSETL